MFNSLFQRWKHKHTTEQQLSLLAQWFATERGERLLGQQRQCIDSALSRCFGYYLLQLSADTRENLFSDCRVQKQYRVHPYAGHCNTQCHFDELPFANESLDVVIVHHVHEFVDNPHQVLREIQRVLVPHGQLIILGFNPYSQLGLYSLVAGLMPGSMWQNRLISSRRIKDWLSLLGFEISAVQYGCHSPACIEQKLGPRLGVKLQQWPLGNFYMVCAIKQVTTMTPVKLRWINQRKHFGGLAPAGPRVGRVQLDTYWKEDVA